MNRKADSVRCVTEDETVLIQKESQLWHMEGS